MKTFSSIQKANESILYRFLKSLYIILFIVSLIFISVNVYLQEERLYFNVYQENNPYLEERLSYEQAIDDIDFHEDEYNSYMALLNDVKEKENAYYTQEHRKEKMKAAFLAFLSLIPVLLFWEIIKRIGYYIFFDTIRPSKK